MTAISLSEFERLWIEENELSDAAYAFKDDFKMITLPESQTNDPCEDGECAICDLSPRISEGGN